MDNPIKPFHFIDCEYNQEWDEGDLINEVELINPHVAVALALNFFGLDSMNCAIDLTAHVGQVDAIKLLFDKHMLSYSFYIGDIHYIKEKLVLSVN